MRTPILTRTGTRFAPDVAHPEHFLTYWVLFLALAALIVLFATKTAGGV